MGLFSKFEGKMEDAFDEAADRMANSPISPVQIAKKAEKEMRREKMVGAGKQYAPTLYTVLVNPDDNSHLFGYYPTLAGETETYLAARAAEQGFVMDGQPLVRFVVDENLKHGKFDIIAEAVAAPIIRRLRDEEMQRYGIAPAPQNYAPIPTGTNRPNYAAANPNYANPNYANAYPQEGFANAPVPPPTPPTATFPAGGCEGKPIPANYGIYARLIDTATNQIYELSASHMRVGRETKNDIALHDPNVSRTHAELRFDAQGVWIITDVGSTNGTFVNGHEISAQALTEGDLITLGTTNLVFSQV